MASALTSSVALRALAKCAATRAMSSGLAAAGQVAERRVAQRALAGRLGRRRIGPLDLVLAVGVDQGIVAAWCRSALRRLLARVVDGERVHVAADDAGEVALARQEHELGAIAGVEALVVET